jgi:hypothetical protein
VNAEKNEMEIGGVRSLTVHIGHDISEYDSVEVLVPVDATREEMLQLAAAAVEDFVANDDRAFCVDPDMSSKDRLRILTIDIDEPNPGEDERLSIDPIPLELNFKDMGNDAYESAKKLERGEFSENQFILDVLNSVYRNSPDPENEISRAFIRSYEESAMEDTQRKLTQIVHDGNSFGVLPDEYGNEVITVTLADKNGNVDNHRIAGPAIILTDDGRPLPVFYPYKNKETGETALVYQETPRDFDNETVRAVFAEGREVLFDDVTAFNKTGMLKVRDLVEGADIVRDISAFIDENQFRPEEEDDQALVMPNEAEAEARAAGHGNAASDSSLLDD